MESSNEINGDEVISANCARLCQEGAMSGALSNRRRPEEGGRADRNERKNGPARQRNRIDSATIFANDARNGDKSQGYKGKLGMHGIGNGHAVFDNFGQVCRQRLGRTNAASRSNDRTKPGRFGFNGKEKREQAKAQSEAGVPCMRALARRTQHSRSVPCGGFGQPMTRRAGRGGDRDRCAGTTETKD